MIRRFTDNAVGLNPVRTENAMKCSEKKFLVLNPSNVLPTVSSKSAEKLNALRGRYSRGGRLTFLLNGRCRSNEDPVIIIVQSISDLVFNGLLINLLQIIVQ